MRIADWLTYTDIEQLKQLTRFYGCQSHNQHSKNELICSLLQQLGKKNHLCDQIRSLTRAEQRFLQLLVFDQSPAYTFEELLGKGRAALDGAEGEPRSLVVSALKRGWLFPGYSHRTQYLYHLPSDLSKQIREIFVEPFLQPHFQLMSKPSFYRDEQGQMMADLHCFLDFLNKEVIRLTVDGAIYKQQQKQIYQLMAVEEKPIASKEPRFGFGRRYHQYPDRFSFLYDYAFYNRYFVEDQEGYLRLNVEWSGNISKQEDEGKKMVRFFIRLYRKPIPHLPIILRWIATLCHPGWMMAEVVYQAIEPWLIPYYYETKESLFEKVTRMLVHLGVLRAGVDGDTHYLSLTPIGAKWLHGITAFREKVIEDQFLKLG
ncbi:hypothetical protein [Laceyella putida]|uniref:Helicase XPB/Ssl2 N-terminal domain-containing protein n=1 Tax=Laceyella putida TaxID=110101 RepID=A0ABW2RM58_9BACL